MCSADSFAAVQVPGFSCRADLPVFVQVPHASFEVVSSEISNCTSSDSWADTDGATCRDYLLNAEAVRNTYDCAFSGYTITDNVGALHDGDGMYGPHARCSWILAPEYANSVMLSVYELDLREGDTLEVYQCVSSSCVLPLLLLSDSLSSLSGNVFPLTLQSSTGIMLVTFSSKGLGESQVTGHTGFVARFASDFLGAAAVLRYDKYL